MQNCFNQVQFYCARARTHNQRVDNLSLPTELHERSERYSVSYLYFCYEQNSQYGCGEGGTEWLTHHKPPPLKPNFYCNSVCVGGWPLEIWAHEEKEKNRFPTSTNFRYWTLGQHKFTFFILQKEIFSPLTRHCERLFDLPVPTNLKKGFVVFKKNFLQVWGTRHICRRQSGCLKI